MSNTLYDILEVSPNASLQIIRSAYRTLSQQYHPDKNSGVQTATLMAEINRAYMVLSDPLKRKEYDVSLTGLAGKAATRERTRREYRDAASRDTEHRHREHSRPQDDASDWHQSENRNRDSGQSEDDAADPPPNSQWREPAEEENLQPLLSPTRFRWVFALGSAAVVAAIVSSFSQALKTAEVVADTKELAIAGQWRLYNQETPHLAADAYFTGQGAPQNYDKARELYLKIAGEKRATKTAEGLIDERGQLALRRLGEIHAKGLGVPPDWAHAIAFYEEAAQSGDIPSMSALAEYYSAEQTNHTNLLAAYSWYNKLAAVTNRSYTFSSGTGVAEYHRTLADALKKRDDLERRLSPDELRRAQSM